MRSLAYLALALISLKSQAAIIEIDYEFDLVNNGSVHLNVNSTDTSSGRPSYGFSNIFSDQSIPDTVVGRDDTLRIDISFAPGQRLRWYDDGNVNFGNWSETFQVTAYGGNSFTNRPSRYAYQFKEAQGDVVLEQFEWFPTSLFAGGLNIQFQTSGNGNLTDSFFDFSGLVVEMDFSVSDPLVSSTTVSQLAISFSSGVFEILQSTPSTQVQAPPILSLFLGALMVMLIRGKKFKA